MSKVKKSAKSPKKPVVKRPKAVKANARLRQKPQYKSFRLHKRVKHHEPPIISVTAITRKAFRLLWSNKKNVLFFSVIYGILFILFVRGVINPINIDDIRFEIESASGESGTSLSSNTLIFNQLIGTVAGGLTGAQGIYQIMLIVIGSLALIWLFRQNQAGNKVSIKQAFYRGMYPLIPFLLIVYVIALQLLPAVIGNFLYSTVIANGIAVGAVEQFVWLLLYLSLLVFSFYLISSSIIALMVVTLPQMTPMIAMKKAKDLVTFRRFAVFRKTTMLMLIIAAIFAIVLFPSLFVSSLLAQILFLVLSIMVLPFAVAYIFVLYRELL